MVKGAEALATTTMAAAEGSSRAPGILAGMSPQGVPLAHDGDSVQDAARQRDRERLYTPISSAPACTDAACMRPQQLVQSYAAAASHSVAGTRCSCRARTEMHQTSNCRATQPAAQKKQACLRLGKA